MKNLVKFILLVALSISFSFGEELSKDEALKSQGKKVYDYWCKTCHGEGMPGTNALVVLYDGTGIPAELEKRDDLSPDLVEYFVRQGKHSMPFFRKTEINDEELKALQAYLSKDN